MRTGEDFKVFLLGGRLGLSTIHLRTEKQVEGKEGAGRGQPRLHD